MSEVSQLILKEYLESIYKGWEMKDSMVLGLGLVDVNMINSKGKIKDITVKVMPDKTIKILKKSPLAKLKQLLGA